MTNNIKYSLSDVRNSIIPGSDKYWVFRFIIRPLSNYVTVPFLNLGFSANQVSFFRLFLVFLSFLIIIIPGYNAQLIAVTIICFSIILDCVDGNICRVKNSASFFGKFVDGIVDGIFVSFFPLFLGLSLFVEHVSAYWVFIGIVCCIVSLISQWITARYNIFLKLVNHLTETKSNESREHNFKKKENIKRFISSTLVTGTVTIPIFLVIPSYGKELSLVAYMVCQVFCDITLIILTYIEARTTLAWWRKSVQSAKQ